MIKEYLQKVIDNEDLTFEESFDSMSEIMNGNVNNSHLAGFLIALKKKGETAPELRVLLKLCKRKASKLNVMTEM